MSLQKQREFFPVAFVTPSQFGGFISGGDRAFKLAENKNGGFTILVNQKIAHKTIGELMEELQAFLDGQQQQGGEVPSPQNNYGNRANNKAPYQGQQAAPQQTQPQQQAAPRQATGYRPQGNQQQQNAAPAAFPKKDYRNTQKPAAPQTEDTDVPF